MDHGGREEEDCRAALLHGDVRNEERQPCCNLGRRVYEESKKLWVIVGPAIFTRTTSYSMNVIMQAFAGHLGDLELASVSFACTVLVGFNYGIMLGMASALETLCGQAFGAKTFHLMGVHMQRSWIVLFMCALLLLPLYFFAEDILLLTGQPPELSTMAGQVAIWFIPLHFSFAFLFPLQRFLQCQLKNFVVAVTSAAALCIHLFISWLFVSRFQFGLTGVALALSISWWVTALLLFAYVSCGGCPETWHGFSVEAFAGIWEFVKLSSASGVMLCLEHWYYRILIVLTGNLKDAAIAVDALSICMLINGCEMMIPLAFFTGTGVRVANELGAGNGSGARFAAIVSSTTSLLIGLFFFVLTIGIHDKIALVFTTSTAVLDAFDKLYLLLAFTVLLNSIQPVLSGVAVGSAWQSKVAYINIGCYYLVGLPMGILLEWIFNLGVLGIWGGMIGGTAIQTLILTVITVRCDWEKEAMIASTRMLKLSQVQ
ncbi:protein DETOXIFICATION 27-like [Phragmites australis]|uniref:protein DETOXIFICATION 27-like n=1 Tax=Phragmites australis TaxID=29695 RepID=UPI002D7A1525|nr:protein DETOXIFICATION 27-like [Phragmites australis]